MSNFSTAPEYETEEQDSTEFNAPEWDTDDLAELGQQEAWEDSYDF